MFKNIQIVLNSIFKKLKFFEISNDKGQTLLFDSSTISVGDTVNMRDSEGNVQPAPDGEYELVASNFAIKVYVSDGKVYKIVNAETGDEITSIDTSAGTKTGSDVQSSVDVKQSNLDFYSYLNDIYLSNKSSDFPWDECVSQMESEGYDCPECICAAIKNRTVEHIVNEYGKDVKEAVKLIAEDISNTKYISKKNKESFNKEAKDIEDFIKQMNDRIDKNIQEIKNEIENIKATIINQNKMPRQKPNISKECDMSINEYRAKYFGVGLKSNNK